MIRASLSTYAQVLFGSDPWVGLLLLAATLVEPWVGLHGLAAVLIATGTAWALGVDPISRDDGLFGYNALLFGLGVGALLPAGLAAEVVLVVGAAATVVMTSALRDGALRSGLPVLTLPFLVVLWLAWMVAPSLGLLPTVLPGPDLGLPEPVAGALRALGGLVFVPRVETGALVLAALLRWSRQGVVLAGVGFLVAAGLLAALPGALDPAMPPLLALNLGLVAIAIGGVWFVPSWTSAFLAAAAAAVAGLITLGLWPLFGHLGLPLFIAPFNLTAWIFLLATRQRMEDRAPKSVDFLVGTPEQNLQYFRTRLARFGARYVVRLRAPVRGSWEVTQSHGDGPTHQGPWAWALDLEVLGPEGQPYRGNGATVQQHLCYHLPVLACADGVVAKIVDGVPDNPIGEVDLDDNWGNVVVLWHGTGLYSLVAHLSPGTIAVTEGQRVRRGEVLGQCGSSGRSPRPHLHFQVQATPTIGAPTLPLELHDVVHEREEGLLLRGTWMPETGDRLRNLVPEGDMVDALGLVPGRTIPLTCDGRHTLELTVEIDALGRHVIRAGEGQLLYGQESDLFTVIDTLAPRDSVLHVLHAALPRLPLEDGATGLVWYDHFPARLLFPAWLRPFQDAIAPFVPEQGLEMRYEMRRDGIDRVVEGRSTREAGGKPRVMTRAVLRPGVGIVEIERTLGGRRVRAWRDGIQTSERARRVAK